MDLRAIANSCSVVINPNVTVSLRASTGSAIVNYRQVPAYAPDVVGPAQIQALDGSDLKQIEGLNIQGDLRAIYIRGLLRSVLRPAQVGGDLIIIAAPAPAELVGTWLITKMLETWPLWAKAVIVRQGVG